MSKKAKYILGIVLTIIICMILAWFFCCGTAVVASDTENKTDRDKELVREDAATNAVSENSGAFTIAGIGSGAAIYQAANNFNFNKSSYDPVLPVDQDVTNGVGTLKEYLDADGNKDKMLRITGYYDQGEQNTSAFSNLGLARANAVKNYLVNEGVDSKRIETNGELNDALALDGDVYRGPLSYNIFQQTQGDVDNSEKEMNAIRDAIRAAPLVLYFNTAEASVSLNDEQRTKMSKISRYLDKVDGASITVIGHTDGRGSAVTNERLGLDRAKFARNYLKNNGIPESKIKTVSKGESELIASDDTAEGRAKNRRAVITIN